jgi:hypothetical protein
MFAQDDRTNERDVVVQPRGPVHEAYAQPDEQVVKPGVVVPKQPPDPIPEIPPDQRPEGDNVVWIPGYWAWDLGRNDFLWVSGIWRAVPEGRKWAPGYWTEVEDGWQWISGFWSGDRQEDVQYLDEPPDSLDYGPPTDQPDDASFWVPGCWLWRSQRFAWRPGYWMDARPGFIWTAAHYCWTPSGCVFVDGYWDRALTDRGCLFAPVYFNQPLWNNPAWFYQPNYCVNFGGLLTSLFVRPSYCHYYFGDYYGPNYARLGFTPWFKYGRYGYDPLFAYYRWVNRRNPGWYRGLVRGGRNRNLLSSVNMVMTLNRFAKTNNVRLINVSHAQINRFRSAERSYRNFGRVRQRLESSGHGRVSALSLARLPGARNSRDLGRSVTGRHSLERSTYPGYRAYGPPNRSSARSRFQSARGVGRRGPAGSRSYRSPSPYGQSRRTTRNGPMRSNGRTTPRYRSSGPNGRSRPQESGTSRPRGPSRSAGYSGRPPRPSYRSAPTYRRSPRPQTRYAPRSSTGYRGSSRLQPRYTPYPSPRSTPRPARSYRPAPGPRPAPPRPSGGDSTKHSNRKK